MQEDISAAPAGCLKNICVSLNSVVKSHPQLSWYTFPGRCTLFIIDKLFAFSYLFNFLFLSVQRILWFQLQFPKMVQGKIVNMLKSAVKAHFVVWLNYLLVVREYLKWLLLIWYFCYHFPLLFTWRKFCVKI